MQQLRTFRLNKCSGWLSLKELECVWVRGEVLILEQYAWLSHKWAASLHHNVTVSQKVHFSTGNWPMRSSMKMGLVVFHLLLTEMQARQTCGRHWNPVQIPFSVPYGKICLPTLMTRGWQCWVFPKSYQKS